MNLLKQSRNFLRLHSSLQLVPSQCFARLTPSLKKAPEKLEAAKFKRQELEVLETRLNEIDESNQFNEIQNVCQHYLLTAKSVDRIIELFEHFKEDMNLINQSTCLHKLSLLRNEAQKKENSNDLKDTNSIESYLIEQLTGQVHFLKVETVSFFISDLIRLKRLEFPLVSKIAQEAVKQSWNFSVSHISIFVDTLAKHSLEQNQLQLDQKKEQQNNEQQQGKQDQVYLSFFTFSKLKLLKIVFNHHLKTDFNIIFIQKSLIEPHNLSQIFHAYGSLKLVDEEFTNYLEAQIYRASQQFTLLDLLWVFLCYERRYYSRNVEVLDALSGRFMDLGNHMKISEISGMLQMCSSLQYVNQILFQYIEKQILRRVKSKIMSENSDAIGSESSMSVIEKYVQQSREYSTEELELFNNLLGKNQQNAQQQQLQQDNKEKSTTDSQNINNTSDKQESNVLNQLNEQQQYQQTQTLQEEQKELEEQNENEEEKEEDDEIIEVHTDQASIAKFQQDFNDQKDLIEFNKHQNLEIIKKYRIKRHKHDTNESITLSESSQILSAFSRLKVIKKELFEVLIANFTLKMEEASPLDLVVHSYAHSLLCQEMTAQFEDKSNSYLKRSMKNIRKYNQNFFEMVLPQVQEKLEQLSAGDIQIILGSIGNNQMTKRSVSRKLINIAIQSTDKLLTGSISPEQRSLLIYKHYALSAPFAYSPILQKELAHSFESKGIPLQTLISRYQHIIPNSTLSPASLPKENKLSIENTPKTNHPEQNLKE